MSQRLAARTLLDSKWLQFLTPILRVLCRGPKMDLVWNFNYAEDMTVFRQACDDLKVGHIVPYQARHSGPSIDRASKDRDMEEVRKRGQWMTRTSVQRYEKAGRLAATWHRLAHSVQMACKSAEKYLEEIILGRDYPAITHSSKIATKRGYFADFFCWIWWSV